MVKIADRRAHSWAESKNDEIMRFFSILPGDRQPGYLALPLVPNGLASCYHIRIPPGGSCSPSVWIVAIASGGRRHVEQVLAVGRCSPSCQQVGLGWRATADAER